MSETNRTLIKTDGISVGYRKKVIAENISFTVNHGEILTLIGPNGSGKSTILKSIASQLELKGGTVFLNENDISKLNERDIAKQLSVMLTGKINTELMTCRDVVESGRYPYTNMLGILSENDRKSVEDAMKLTGVTELSDSEFTQISDGQRQRVLLAKAVCQEPDILILDEPTSFLDIKHKLELLNILKKLVHEKGTGVVMSLHELDLAMKISDKVLCIKNGKADRYGSAEEIFTSEYIENLYDIESGTFNAVFGSSELPSANGNPEIFVIGGGGNAVNLYRKLQRKGTAFAVGVLHENDIEYPIAKALAVQVITEKAFEPVSSQSVEKALEIMKKCRKVICTIKEFGTMNSGNKILFEKAVEMGIVSEL